MDYAVELRKGEWRTTDSRWIYIGLCSLFALAIMAAAAGNAYPQGLMLKSGDDGQLYVTFLGAWSVDLAVVECAAAIVALAVAVLYFAMM